MMADDDEGILCAAGRSGSTASLQSRPPLDPWTRDRIAPVWPPQHSRMLSRASSLTLGLTSASVTPRTKHWPNIDSRTSTRTKDQKSEAAGRRLASERSSAQAPSPQTKGLVDCRSADLLRNRDVQDLFGDLDLRHVHRNGDLLRRGGAHGLVEDLGLWHEHRNTAADAGGAGALPRLSRRRR